MRRCITFIAVLIVAGTLPLTAQSVRWGVAPHVGTLGLGADVGIAFSPRIGVRAGGNFFPSSFSGTASDINFDIDMPSPSFTALVDLMLAGPLRLTGGLLFQDSDIEVVGNLNATVEIGNATYNASDVGTLFGAFDTKSTAPYIGLGLGQLGAKRVGFFLDAGVAFHGKPEVVLLANGPIADPTNVLYNPTFLSDLEAERQDIESDISGFTVYPVLTIGLAIGF